MSAPDCRRCDHKDRAERAERDLRDASRASATRVAELERERDAALIERDAARATVSELVEVMAMALDWAECDAKSLAAIEARKRWPDHLPTGFETRVARLRAALAKAKRATNG